MMRNPTISPVTLSSQQQQLINQYQTLQQQIPILVRRAPMLIHSHRIRLIAALETIRHEINRLIELGFNFKTQKKLDLALVAFQRATYFAQQACPELLAFQAAGLNGAGSIYHQQHDFDAARIHYETALNYLQTSPTDDENDQLNVADSLLNIGMLDTSEKKLSAALEKYYRVLDIIGERRDFRRDDIRFAAFEGLVTIHRIHRGEETHHGLFSILTRCLSLAELIDNQEQEPFIEMHSALGAHFHEKGIYDQALHHQQLALKLQLKISPHEKLHQAILMNNLAITYQSQHKTDRAISLYEQALAIKLAALAQTTTDAEKKTTAISILDGLHNLATIKNRYQKKAAESLELSRMVLSDLYPILGDAHPSFAHTLNCMSQCYFTLSQIPMAVETSLRALAIFKLYYSAPHSDITETLAQLSQYFLSFNLPRAIQYIEEALSTLDQVYSPEHSTRVHVLRDAEHLYKRAEIQESTSEIKLTYRKKVINCYQQILKIDHHILTQTHFQREFELYDLDQHYQTIVKLLEAYRSQLNFAEAAKLSKKWAYQHAPLFPILALQLVKHALQDFKQLINSASEQAKLYFLRSSLYQKLRQPSRAIKAIKKAVALQPNNEWQKILLNLQNELNLSGNQSLQMQIEYCRYYYTKFQLMLFTESSELAQSLIRKISQTTENQLTDLIIKINALSEQTLLFLGLKADDSANTANWRQSLQNDALLAISNGGKHMRLSSKETTSDLVKKIGSFHQRKIRVNLECTNPQPTFHVWHIMYHLNERFATQGYTEADLMQTAHQLFQLLKQKKWINDFHVTHPLAKALMNAVLEKKSAEEIAQHLENFYFSLHHDLGESLRLFVNAINNFLILRLLQQFNLTANADYLIEAHELIETKLTMLEQLIATTATSSHSIATVASLANLSPVSSIDLKQRCDQHQSKLENQLIKNEIISLHDLQTYHLDLKQLIQQYREEQNNIAAGDQLASAGRWLQDIFPALSLHYFAVAEREYQKTTGNEEKYFAFYNDWLKLANQLNLSALSLKIKLNAVRKVRGELNETPRPTKSSGQGKSVSNDLITPLMDIEIRYYELHYLTFKLSLAPENDLLNHTIHNELFILYTKIHHLLEQALARFAQEKIFRPQQVFGKHQIKYPNAMTEKDFLKQLNYETPLKGKLLYSGSSASLDQYPEVYEAIKQSQAFSYKAQGKLEESWLEKMTHLSNRSKHAKIDLLNIAELTDWLGRESINSKSGFTNLYPIKFEKDNSAQFLSGINLLQKAIVGANKVLKVIFKHMSNESVYDIETLDELFRTTLSCAFFKTQTAENDLANTSSPDLSN